MAQFVITAYDGEGMRNILFITASKSVYTLKMLVHGVQ